MAKNRRVNVKAILADPDLRRKLMVSTIQATQAREGIETTEEQADRAYYVVSEGERATFFALRPFRGVKRGETDRRNEVFVRAIRGETKDARFDVARRDFCTVKGSPLIYAQVGVLSPLIRETTPLDPTWASVRGGMNSTASEQFVRHHWEVSIGSTREWVRYSKGGDYARYYRDLDLVFDWTHEGTEFRAIVKEKYGSESRFVKSPEFYFRRGLTWTEKSSLGFSVRILESGAIFNVAGPAAFPVSRDDEWYLLGVLNSSFVAYVAWAFSGRNYGASYISTIPIASTNGARSRIEETARELFDRKARWDEGNETSTRFKCPWLVLQDLFDSAAGLNSRLSRLAQFEAAEEARLQRQHAELTDEIYKLYSVPDGTRAVIEESLAGRPAEILWREVAGKTAEQKRMEHVWRLLSFAVKHVIEMDEDGIVPFAPLSGETSLLDRVHDEIAALFPEQDVNQVEVEIANELKRTVKGYKRASSIGAWLNNVYFDYHTSLYKKRPIVWHIASNQGSSSPAFGALCRYDKFDANRIAKLRSTYLRDAMDAFRREAALADKERRAEDRIEWQAKLEETQALDRKLQAVQEGHHEGAEGEDNDYRILTPWKAPEDRPKGWAPDIDDGVKVNIEPLQKADVLRLGKVV